MIPLLEARNVSVSRGERITLRRASLTLRPADFLLIAGPNGSGKSTLLRALAGIWPIQAGEILLHEKPLALWSRREIARLLSYVPQDTRIDFGFTVRELVTMGRHPHIRRFASESIADRSAVDRGMALADIEHLQDRTVNSLSGGERQRVLIARCLAAEPSIILLDEPTASLDLSHALEIFALCRRLADAGAAVAVCTHDLNTGLRHAKSLLLLDGGDVAHQGPIDPSLEREVIERVFGVRVEPLATKSQVPHFLFHPKDDPL
jgi:iron complex transport system ATP-binding protein